MKRFQAEEETGTLTDRRRKNAEDIQSIGMIAGSIGSHGADDEGSFFEPTITDSPLAAIVMRERGDGMRSGLRDAMQRLAPIEAEVITTLTGLDGIEVTSVRQLASEVGREPTEVQRIKDRAVHKDRKHLIASSDLVARQAD